MKFPELLDGAENDSLGGSIRLCLCLAYVRLPQSQAAKQGSSHFPSRDPDPQARYGKIF